jgi:hypothetical protein
MSQDQFNEDIADRLLEIANRLYEIQKRMLAISREARPIRGSLSTLRDRVYVEVRQEVNEKGKPSFSNERLRAIEVRRRLDEHPEYLADRPRLRELEEEEKDCSAEWNHLIDLKEILYVRSGVILPEPMEFPGLGEFGQN